MDIVCRDRISKELSFCVTLKHNLKEDSVDEVNLSLAGAVCKAYKLATDDTVLVHHICGRSKVECKIEERGLCAGTAVTVYAEHEVLHRLLNFCIRQAVLFNERSEKGIETVECNSTHNLVLENSDQVCTLIQDRIEVLGGGRGRDVGNSANTLHQDVLEGITCAIQSKTAEVVKVHITIDIRLSDMLGINLTKPVVLADFCGDVFVHRSEAERSI